MEKPPAQDSIMHSPLSPLQTIIRYMENIPGILPNELDPFCLNIFALLREEDLTRIREVTTGQASNNVPVPVK